MDKLKGLASKLGNKGEGNTSGDPNAAAGSANVSSRFSAAIEDDEADMQD